jgi:hypothetical protein
VCFGMVLIVAMALPGTRSKLLLRVIMDHAPVNLWRSVSVLCITGWHHRE